MTKKLWNHQRYAIDKYKDRPFFGLLFDMGLGKTLTATRIAEEKEKPGLINTHNDQRQQWKYEMTDKRENSKTTKH